jgi:hypothetical protein
VSYRVGGGTTVTDRESASHYGGEQRPDVAGGREQLPLALDALFLGGGVLFERRLRRQLDDGDPDELRGALLGGGARGGEPAELSLGDGVRQRDHDGVDEAHTCPPCHG